MISSSCTTCCRKWSAGETWTIKSVSAAAGMQTEGVQCRGLWLMYWLIVWKNFQLWSRLNCKLKHFLIFCWKWFWNREHTKYNMVALCGHLACSWVTSACLALQCYLWYDKVYLYFITCSALQKKKKKLWGLIGTYTVKLCKARRNYSCTVI